MSAWVFLLLGGVDSIVFGPIRWCVWSFRPSSPLRLPHLKFLFVCFVYMHALSDENHSRGQVSTGPLANEALLVKEPEQRDAQQAQLYKAPGARGNVGIAFASSITAAATD